MLLTLDSSTLSNVSSDDFTVNFSSPLNVNGGIHELCLIKCNLWYSYYNVSGTDYSNNTIVYNNGAQNRTVVFPDGNYTIIQLNNYLSAAMAANGDSNTSIVLEPNYSTLKVKITLLNGYSINFTGSDFCLLLGWNKQVYNFNGSRDGPNPANINRDINSLFIQCDIISGSYKNGVLNNILYSFTPSVPPGSNIEISLTKPIYLPVQIPDFISKIRMKIIDNLGRRVNLNNQPVTYLLHLRKKQELYNPTIRNI
jgi:hypothetical protein